VLRAQNGRDGGKQRRGDEEIEHLVHDAWVNLREIIWDKWKAPCISITARLRSLTFVHLPQRSRKVDNNYKNDPINYLCYLLWKNKEICPSLNTISSEMFPLWDLLFLTIHSRIRCGPSPRLCSSAASEGGKIRETETSRSVTGRKDIDRKSEAVSSITTLHLPFLPTTPLLKRLVDLLAGRLRDDIVGVGSVISQRSNDRT
jgi:hypothetical protein